MTQRIYFFSFILDGWQVTREGAKAITEKAAKGKLRRRYGRKATSFIAGHSRKPEPFEKSIFYSV